MPREINSIHDVSEADVEAAHDFAQLCDALADYAGEQPDHKATFDETLLRNLAQMSEEVFQELAVVVAYAQDQQIDPTDLMAEYTNE